MFKKLFQVICFLSMAFGQRPVNGSEKSDALSIKVLSTNDLRFIENFIDYSDTNTLVLWDVDQTLITPDDSILKPKWENLLDQWLGGKKVISDESGKARYVFREILMNASHSVVDRRSFSLIEKIQRKGIPMIAFTAAPAGKIGEKTRSFIDWRVHELKEFGFDFSASFPDIQSMTLPKSPKNEFPPIYKSGVLVTSLHDKGPVLMDFFQQIEWKPQKVIFIDDKMANIQSVIQALENEIQVIGIHYTAASDFPCELDGGIAYSQVQHFLKTNEWLSQTEMGKKSCSRF